LDRLPIASFDLLDRPRLLLFLSVDLLDEVSRLHIASLELLERRNRPEVRETAPALGDLLSELDFTQTPNAPLVLPPCPDGGDLVYSEAGACQP
jgi:hypothetical protein